MAAAPKIIKGSGATPRDGALPVRWFLVAAVVAASWFAATTAVSSQLDGTAETLFELSATAGTLAAATVAALWTAFRGTGEERRWRLLLAAAGAASTAKAALNAWDAAAHGAATTTPASFQLGDIVADLLLIATLAAVPATPVTSPGESTDPAELARPRWHRRSVTVLDGIMIATSVMLLRWVIVLKPVFESGGQSAADAGITLARNLCGVLVVTSLLLILASRRPRNPRVMALMGTGLVFLSLGQAASANLVATPNRSTGGLATGCFVAGVLCAGLATTAPRRQRDRMASHRVRRSALWFRVLLPYLPLATTLPLAVAQLVSTHAAGGLEIGLGLAVICAVLVRQVVTLVQNAWLLAGLHENQRLLRHRAYHDDLTGLHNRAFLLEQLSRLTDGDGSPDGRRRALLFCDLDDFKLVNDQLGHDVGDVVLQLAAARLRTCVRAEDLVARLGGDEFAILLSSSADDPTAVGSRVVAAMESPFEIADHHCLVRASVGITRLQPSTNPDSPRTVLRRADAAMYAAKRGGKDAIAVLDI